MVAAQLAAALQSANYLADTFNLSLWVSGRASGRPSEAESGARRPCTWPGGANGSTGRISACSIVFSHNQRTMVASAICFRIASDR